MFQLTVNIQLNITGLTIFHQDHRGLFTLRVEPDHPVDLVEILLYLTKLDSKQSLGIKDLGRVTDNLRDSVLGQALRSKNNTIMVPCLLPPLWHPPAARHRVFLWSDFQKL